MISIFGAPIELGTSIIGSCCNFLCESLPSSSDLLKMLKPDDGTLTIFGAESSALVLAMDWNGRRAMLLVNWLDSWMLSNTEFLEALSGSKGAT